MCYSLLPLVSKYPSMDVQPYRDMIAGMVMDVPGLGQTRYENFEELYTYCYRVAGTVGLMTLPVLGMRSKVVDCLLGVTFIDNLRVMPLIYSVGTAKGFTQEEATPSAVALGIGLQVMSVKSCSTHACGKFFDLLILISIYVRS